ncbi:hypothetical protein BDV95DRAFT_601621 [Massariosphaeria phaeospora]|uniref:Uncharacterized protein n=1 Tax=Massariosphaeria phaeospora TaxID=100035 RepID=A0A7C8MX94_9PLEO|nr:hypothetical protein BDV95DRAFT_601621 [Massariosphaeria phaeospora]
MHRAYRTRANLPGASRQQVINPDLDPSKIVAAVQHAALTKETNARVDYARCQELLETVRRSVKTAMRSADDEQPEWQEQVLDPIVETFDVHTGIVTQEEEADFILLLSTTVLLGYEILRQRAGNPSDGDEDFIIASLVEYFREAKARDYTAAAVEAEYKRVGKADLSLNNLNALWRLSGLISTARLSLEGEDEPYGTLSERPQDKSPAKESPVLQEENLDDTLSTQCSKISIEDEALDWPLRLAKAKSSASLATVKSSASLASPKTVKSARSPATVKSSTSLASVLSPSTTPYYRNVQLQFFSKPGRTHTMNSVNSIRVRNDTFVIETCVRVSMRVEEGTTISDIPGELDSVTVKRPGGTGCELAATVVIPPGFKYDIADIISVGEDADVAD